MHRIRNKLARVVSLTTYGLAFVLMLAGFVHTRNARQADEFRYQAVAARDEAIYSLQVSLHYGVITVDDEGRVLEWNPYVESITGYTALEAVGKPLVDFMPEEDRPRHLSGYARIINDPNSIGKLFHLTCRLLNKDGSMTPIDINARITKASFKGAKPFGVALVSKPGSVIEIETPPSAKNEKSPPAAR